MTSLASRKVSSRPTASRPSRGPVKNSSTLEGRRKGYWIVGGVAVYAFTTYGTYLYRSYHEAIARSQALDVPADVSDRYDEAAKTFDQDIDLAETLMGIGRLRRRLARRAHGDVLEVSAGTGRNLDYYPWDQCRRLLFVDKSRPMLQQARDRFVKLRTTGGYRRQKDVEFLVQDATRPIRSPPPAGFDTIIQTMGLCSTPDPVQLLKHLATLANQEHGQILLLEHGRSHYQWMNDMLDSLAKAHANKHGCWWNQDIGRIVNESGLEIVELKRYHLGTTWWIELRPKRAGS